MKRAFAWTPQDDRTRPAADDEAAGYQEPFVIEELEY